MSTLSVVMCTAVGRAKQWLLRVQHKLIPHPVAGLTRRQATLLMGLFKVVEAKSQTENNGVNDKFIRTHLKLIRYYFWPYRDTLTKHELSHPDNSILQPYYEVLSEPDKKEMWEIVDMLLACCAKYAEAQNWSADDNWEVIKTFQEKLYTSYHRVLKALYPDLMANFEKAFENKLLQEQHARESRSGCPAVVPTDGSETTVGLHRPELHVSKGSGKGEDGRSLDGESPDNSGSKRKRAPRSKEEDAGCPVESANNAKPPQKKSRKRLILRDIK